MFHDFAERTEAPTPRRLAEARQQGNVARSNDLASAMLLAAVVVILWAAAPWMLEQAKQLLELALSSSAADLSAAGAAESSFTLATSAVGIVLPVMLLVWIAGWLAPVMQIGWLFTLKPVQPTASRLSPVKGVRRMLGLAGLVRALLDLLKVLLVLAVASLTIWQYAERLAALPNLDLMAGASAVGAFMLDLFMRVLATLLALGALDYIFQRWRHARELRMTREELKDEMKQTEGDPDVKRIRSRQQYARLNPRPSARTNRTRSTLVRRT